WASCSASGRSSISAMAGANPPLRLLPGNRPLRVLTEGGLSARQLFLLPVVDRHSIGIRGDAVPEGLQELEVFGKLQIEEFGVLGFHHGALGSCRHAGESLSVGMMSW